MLTDVNRIFKFFASYGLAVVVLTLLTILTLFGTLEQVEHGLFEVQKKYFDSFFLIHYLFGVIPLPLPGAYLLMILLTANLICGALIRAPKSWRRPGMLIAHSGIIYLILAGFVTFHFSSSGYMQLFEDQSSNEYVSYYDWEIAVIEYNGDGPIQKVVVPHEILYPLKPADKRTFHSPHLPFELEVSGFVRNATPRVVPSELVGTVGANGFMLEALPLEVEAERNAAGAYGAVITPDGEREEAVLYAFALAPWMVTVDGREFSIDLRHTRTEVPFTIQLDKFIRELHPRTGIASNFESQVTQYEGNVSRQIEIKMNEPLRHAGFTFFQASWGPEDAGPDDPLFTVFAVVNNPADQWPLYACLVIAFGLTVHFSQKLYGYIRAENRRRP